MLRYWKSARRCGVKHIPKSNCANYTDVAHQRRTIFGSGDVEKVQAVVARSACPNQNAESTPCSDHFWKLTCRKSARCCGTKHISKSKVQKNWGVRSTFGRSDVVLRGRRRDSAPCQKWEKREGFVAVSTTTTTTVNYTPLHYTTTTATITTTTTLHYTNYITLHYATLHWITLHYSKLHYTNYNYSYNYNYTTLHYPTLLTLHYITLHFTSPHNTTLHSTTLHYNYSYNYNCNYNDYITLLELFYTTLHYTTPHYTTPHRTAPHHTTLHNTTLH